jgi:hypothetical protein
VALLKPLLVLRREHFKDGVVALDCGANIGVHAVEWGRLMLGWGERARLRGAGKILLRAGRKHHSEQPDERAGHSCRH